MIENSIPVWLGFTMFGFGVLVGALSGAAVALVWCLPHLRGSNQAARKFRDIALKAMEKK